MSNLPKQVTLNECWARDGLQNQEQFIETEHKQKMLELIAEAGFSRMEVTSFSHPKYVPQFKDSEELLSRLTQIKNVSFKATCVNHKALIRAIEAKQKGYPVHEVSFVVAASEQYNLVNVRMSQEDLLKQVDENIELAKANGLGTLVSISTAFGCPYKGKITKEEVFRLVDYFIERKVDRISLGDTTGMCNPVQAYELFSALKTEFPETTLIAHFHDTKGWGITNAYASLMAGVDHFDVSLGGIGGPPAQRLKSTDGNTGNLCTEDFVILLQELNIETGINVQKMFEAGKYSEQLLGIQRSQILRTVQ